MLNALGSGGGEVFIFSSSWSNKARAITSICESTIVSIKNQVEVPMYAAGISGDVDGQI
uniref:Uncharacterized protein n=1 Tax=Physcomitrium patens TaxID=3218 RepID=A0A2K1JBP7_PHYPA|nr:hypothetical protein PHYPA_019237 [Physcomitrium patens]